MKTALLTLALAAFVALPVVAQNAPGTTTPPSDTTPTDNLNPMDSEDPLEGISPPEAGASAGWQGQDPCAPRPGGNLKKGRHGGAKGGGMARLLALTDQQKSQLQSLRANTKAQVEAVCNDSSLTPQQKADKIRGLRQAQQQDMMNVLTPEQQQKLKQMRQRQRGRWRRHHKNDGTTDTNTNNPPRVSPPTATNPKD